MMHFFDIGANVATTFDRYLMKSDRYDGWHIWCFEPSPRSISELRQRCSEIVADNSHRYKITICPFALGAKTKWCQLFEKGTSEGDSLFETTFVGDVQVMNEPDTELDIICAQINVVDFMLFSIPEGEKVVLKIDCEGCEYEIFGELFASKSAQSRIERVMVEFHGLGQYETDLRLRLYKEFQILNIPIQEWKL